jgi:hypothetical protein
MSTPRGYSKPMVRVYGDVAVLTRNAKKIASCQDKFNASPNPISAENNQCSTSTPVESFGSH